MKKIVSKILWITISCLFIFGITGCDRTRSGLPIGKLPEYESGYYKYSVDTLPDGTQKAYITGLTELGKEQKELVYPSTIEGYTVYGLGYNYHTGVYPLVAGKVESENLQKFYMPTLQIENVGAFYLVQGKVIIWNNSYGDELTYKDVFGEEPVYGYNLYKKKGTLLFAINLQFSIANVSYMYNYDNSPNDGYYWVDTYNESLITFIPPNPTRDGYTFGGWYKDTDCITKWNFETDITGKEIYIERGNTFNENNKDDQKLLNKSYEGIYLYAKWVPNNF